MTPRRLADLQRASAEQSGSRVMLRTPTIGDREEFIAGMRDSHQLHHPWLSAPTTPDAYAGLMARVGDPRYEPMLACLRQTGAIVGFFNINEIIRGLFQSAFLGYGAVAAYAGQGLMSEGLQQVLARAFGELGLHRLEANVQPGNRPSIALVRRNGFVYEGLSRSYLKIGGSWRDHERWAIRSELWRPEDPSRAGEA